MAWLPRPFHTRPAAPGGSAAVTPQTNRMRERQSQRHTRKPLNTIPLQGLLFTPTVRTAFIYLSPRPCRALRTRHRAQYGSKITVGRDQILACPLSCTHGCTVGSGSTTKSLPFIALCGAGKARAMNTGASTRSNEVSLSAIARRTSLTSSSSSASLAAARVPMPCARCAPRACRGRLQSAAPRLGDSPEETVGFLSSLS